MNEIKNSLEFDLNLGFLGYCMYPFVKFVQIISSFKIDLGSVSVTCLGAQAPMVCIPIFVFMYFFILTFFIINN